MPYAWHAYIYHGTSRLYGNIYCLLKSARVGEMFMLKKSHSGFAVKLFWRRLLSNSSTGTDAKKTASGANNALGIALFSSLCIGTFGLGVWQTQRYNWKIRVLEEMKKKLSESPEILPQTSLQSELREAAAALQGRRVKVTGRFDHDGEILLGVRSAPAGLFGASAQGMSMNPLGYYVITPFHRDDGTILFINRGWVSNKLDSWHRPQGTVTLSTIVSEWEKPTAFSPPNDLRSTASRRVLIWLDPEAAIKHAGKNIDAKDAVILEVIDETEAHPTSYPASRKLKNLSEHHVSPITHVSYAVTWFALSGLGTMMTYKMFRKPVRRIRTSPSVTSSSTTPPAAAATGGAASSGSYSSSAALKDAAAPPK